MGSDIKIRAERKAGELIVEQDIKPGNPQFGHTVPIAPRPKDLGIEQIDRSGGGAPGHDGRVLTKDYGIDSINDSINYTK